MDKLLNRVGMRIFVKYFKYFTNPAMDNQDIINIIEEDFTDKSKRSRVSKAKRLLREFSEIEILETIVSAKRVDNETKEKAKLKLNQYIQSK